MTTRLSLGRIPFLRPLRPPNAPRTFTHNTSALSSNARPQLPFLAPSRRRPIARFLTTETKQWLKGEVKKGVKITTYLYAGTVLVVLLVVGVQQEILEHRYPSPSDWSFFTRLHYRNTKINEASYGSDAEQVNWVISRRGYTKLLKRLEDPQLDGAGLKDQEDGGIYVAGVGKTGFDITAKPEDWRRGYYEALMGTARCAEYLNDWVVDRTRDLFFPSRVIAGDSNPNPLPVPPGSPAAPVAENCEPASDPPETYYLRILTTRGFTEKQRLDAALAYASWLDAKGTPEAALEAYQWAVDIATADQPKPVIDRSTGVLRSSAVPPSRNVLSAATALAVHHATNGGISTALPIFLSVLRARRSLPEPPKQQVIAADGEEEPGLLTKAQQILTSVITPPKFPPGPDDGTSAPFRDAKERCEEAVVMTYIGEILYASKETKTSREDGLAWTREAVDIAEEELRGRKLSEDAKKTCKQCLEVSLGNWAKMVGRMAREEEELKVKASTSWLGFGSDGKDIVGRWASEQQVVKERQRRVQEVLGNKLQVVA
ncbi:hypothetical protein BP6252_05009 [Coleophoma cylindrospora]|uniref:MFS maltose permease n=1 Tax=Coleophoma cylindrospora TaxID=1849047 RepID=A0A3D8RSM5_9HELO|nr:hypothetical protein BP6252_05009 [Coleophoma cylindrospora]